MKVSLLHWNAKLKEALDQRSRGTKTTNYWAFVKGVIHGNVGRLLNWTLSLRRIPLHCINYLTPKTVENTLVKLRILWGNLVHHRKWLYSVSKLVLYIGFISVWLLPRKPYISLLGKVYEIFVIFKISWVNFIKICRSKRNFSLFSLYSMIDCCWMCTVTDKYTYNRKYQIKLRCPNLWDGTRMY